MSYQKRSRIARKLEMQSKKNVVFATLGTVAIFIAIFKIGIPLLADFGLFIGNFSRTEDNQKGNKTQEFVQQPRIDPLPQATNSASIKITGIAVAKGKVEIFIEEDLISTVEVKEDGTFMLPNLKLRNGENIIKARAILRDNKSELSESLSVIFDTDPPTLEINQPSQDQQFGKGDSIIEVRGKTEIDTKVVVNNFRAIVDSQGNFSSVLALTPGENIITVQAFDLSGNQTEKSLTVTFSP